MLILHEMPLSGNCYKVRMALHYLDIPYERRSVDVVHGATREPSFRRMNANAKVPVLQLDETRFLPESNAILWFLAENSRLLPASRYAHAQVLQWMFFEQYSHEPYIATVRYWRVFSPTPTQHDADIARCMPKGYQALGVMEQHLQRNNYFVENQYSIADIALYAYTHCAAEGGYNMNLFPAISAWLHRVEMQQGYLPIHV